ncbi:prepilin peptidase [Firmicutes bacterium AM43-11BH]|nr:prepilin peptidase [Firmicutes bacterium AM43-11BH]
MSTIINAIYVIILACVAWQDYKTRIIHNKFHIIIFFLAFVQMLLIPEYRMPDRLIGMLVVSAPMLLLTLLIPSAFGGGDIKLMAASGFFLGTSSILCAMNLAIIAGSVYGIIMLKNKKRNRKDRFAFGPFLAIGLAIAAFWGKEIVSWYLKIQH